MCAKEISETICRIIIVHGAQSQGLETAAEKVRAIHLGVMAEVRDQISHKDQTVIM